MWNMHKIGADLRGPIEVAGKPILSAALTAPPSRNVYRLHGSFFTMRCPDSGKWVHRSLDKLQTSASRGDWIGHLNWWRILFPALCHSCSQKIGWNVEKLENLFLVDMKIGKFLQILNIEVNAVITLLYYERSCWPQEKKKTENSRSLLL